MWVRIEGLEPEKLRQQAHEVGIDILANRALSTRRLYRNCFRLNASGDLHDRFDGQRNVQQALAHLADIARTLRY